jgi:hypothetical protein
VYTGPDENYYTAMFIVLQPVCIGGRMRLVSLGSIGRRVSPYI